MKIALTIPSNGAGLYAWTGWSNAFKSLGHTVENWSPPIFRSDPLDCDLLICSTSCPENTFIEWRKNHPDKKIALNVLAWTDEDIRGIHNAGVQATPGNVGYTRDLKPDVVFAQYGEKWRVPLLKNWAKEGYKLSSMMMAVDSTVYKVNDTDTSMISTIVYCGGYWSYKAQNIDKYLLPLFRKYRDQLYLIGKGWPMMTNSDISEQAIANLYRNSIICPNVHEPHSNFGYDIVERCFKVPYCGGLLISDYVEEMIDVGFKDGINCFICKDPKEYTERFEEILQNPTKYDDVRKTGQVFISSQHTYVDRAKALLRDIYGEKVPE